MQVCSQAYGQQPAIAVIFRDKGQISGEEKAAYHVKVHVYWQAKAWADAKGSVDWINTILAEATEGLNHFMLLVDILTGQQTDRSERLFIP